MGACPNGATPTAAGQQAQWIWVGLASYLGNKLAEWERLAPWITGAIADQLVSIPNLCASNPDPPEPITPADILLTAVDPIAAPFIGPNFYKKVWDNLVYDAFQQFCMCNSVAGSCTADIDLVLGQNLEYNHNFPGYGWPTTKPGVDSDPDWNYDYYPWDLSCGNPVVTFWQVPNSGLQIAHNPVRVNDCNGIIYSQSWDENNPFQFTVRQGGTGAHCPGFHLAWAYNVTPTQFPNWHVHIGPAGGGPSPTVPPPAPPDQTSPIPTPPPLKCDATTLCAIQWNLSNRINVAIAGPTYVTNNLLELAPRSYIEGNRYQVSGSGVQVVAQGTLGVAVEFVSLPPALTPTGTEPPRYYNVGWLQLGAADALEQKRWIHSTGERFMPVFPEFDRVHYNLSDQVVVTLVELSPPPTS